MSYRGGYRRTVKPDGSVSKNGLWIKTGGRWVWRNSGRPVTQAQFLKYKGGRY